MPRTPVGNVRALQHVVSGFHILNAAVGAGADHYLVDLDVATLLGTGGCSPAGGGRLTVGSRVFRSMTTVRSYSASGSASYSVQGRWPRPFRYASQAVVHREDAVFGTGFNGHVGRCTGGPPWSGSSRPRRRTPGILYSAPDTPISPIRCRITSLPRHRGVDGTCQLNLDGGRHLEPCHAGCHTGGHIGGANAGGKRAHRTVRAGVAVGTDDAVTGGHNALFGQQGMFNTHLADVIRS